MISGDDDHGDTQFCADRGNGVVIHGNGCRIGDAAVIDIACQQNGAHMACSNYLEKLFQKKTVIFFVGPGAHRHTEVPV